jgi:hypothetical protein
MAHRTHRRQLVKRRKLYEAAMCLATPKAMEYLERMLGLDIEWCHLEGKTLVVVPRMKLSAVTTTVTLRWPEVV